MLVIFPLVFTAIACAVLVLVGIVGRAGARRFGGLVPLLLLPVSLAALGYALWLGVGIWPETRGSNDYGRMAAWTFVFGSAVVGVVSGGVTTVLGIEAARNLRAVGLLRDGAGLGHALRRAVMIVVWTVFAVVAASLLTVLPLQLIYGDAPPPIFEQVGGFVILGALTVAIVLGFNGRLPGTAKRSRAAPP